MVMDRFDSEVHTGICCNLELILGNLGKSNNIFLMMQIFFRSDSVQLSQFSHSMQFILRS